MAIRYFVIGGFSIDTLLFPGWSEPQTLCGGNAPYAAIGAAIWASRPGDIGIVGAVGTTYPRSWLGALRATGIDLTGLEETAGEHRLTFRATYDTAGRRHVDIDTDRLAPRGVHAQPAMERLPTAYLLAEAVLCCQYSLEAQRDHARHLHQGGMRVFLDPSEEESAGLSEPALRELVQPVEVFLPSEMEVPAFLSIGRSPPEMGEVARTLGGYGPRVVAIKLGGRGSVIYDQAGAAVLAVPAYPADVVDPTGAGDAYAGGFMVSYIETGDPLEAALRATVSASLVIERAGALPALQDLALFRREARVRLEELRRLRYDGLSAGSLGATS
ncbi:MAG TPA: carbohydrate kinase family protein [Chloroflexota bacterium]|nr:carbohydrate kinase family protein [Chloroflexota bacterium]